VSEPLASHELARLERLFERAVELPRGEQAAFVAAECGSNEALRRELWSLLEAHGSEDRLGAIVRQAPSRTGTRIGPYLLLERIGEGGMGEVYAAERQGPIARRVALKIIKPGMDSRQVIARFEVERQALARMAHPNIAQVFDGGTTESGSPYFVMELVDGEPIHEHCDRHALSTRERLELFLEVCKGVQHAHQKGIIHRDLKPSNLLVTQQDGRALPKVIDFGVARATNGDLTERTLQTIVGQIVGTLDYMSPEQADPSSVEIDTRSDVYSLGVVLYELLTGLLPFERLEAGGTPLSELQRARREQDPPTPSMRLRRQTGTAMRVAPLHGTDERSLLRQLQGDLDWICIKALEKDPERRYATVDALALDIQRHLDGEPVTAAPPGAGYRLRKFVRRNKAAVITATAVAVALVVGLVSAVVALGEKARADTASRAADRSVASAEVTSEFVRTILMSADPWNEDGKQEKTVLEAMDDAIRDIAAGRFRDYPEIESSLQNTIALILLNRGRMEEAEAMLAQALDTRRKLFHGDRYEVVQSLLNLSLVRSYRYGVAESEARIVQAVEMSERLFPRDHPSLIWPLSCLATQWSKSGRGAEAEPLAVRVLELATRHYGGDHSEVAQYIARLARVRNFLGRTAEAREGFDESIAMMRRLTPSGSAWLADVLWISAEARLANGDAAGALPELEEAVAMAAIHLAAMSPDLARYEETLVQCRVKLVE